MLQSLKFLAFHLIKTITETANKKCIGEKTVLPVVQVWLYKEAINFRLTSFDLLIISPVTLVVFHSFLLSAALRYFAQKRRNWILRIFNVFS